MASELEPAQWSEEILWPIPDRRVSLSIFGYNHVAMGRENSIRVLDALVWTTLCDSMGDARKLIKNNGVKVNRKTISNGGLVLTKADALPNLDAIVLEAGKYNFGIIELC